MLTQQEAQSLHHLQEKALKYPPSLRLQKARNLVLRPLCFPVSNAHSVTLNHLYLGDLGQVVDANCILFSRFSGQSSYSCWWLPV